MNKNIPEIGKEYHFFDDGKISNSRHYIAKVIELIPIEEAKNIIISTPRDYNINTGQNLFVDMSLYDIWLDEKERCDWLYNDDTDYIIKANIPNYDDDPIYFVRTKDDGWFSMDVTNWWQGGRLDIDGKRYENMIKNYESWKK
ncbi:MAG: hypothetical protein IJH39_12170 [Clostridia bacterium]|nr:hypothetical protein [Clostridia bacterium]